MVSTLAMFPELPERNIQQATMRRTSWQICTLILMALPALTTAMYAAQDQVPAPKKDQAPAPNNRLTIEVTAGDSSKPVENASVDAKTIEKHLIKDKKV